MKTILGTAQLARRYGVVAGTNDPTTEQSNAILDEAMRTGIDALDTAPVYGNAETVIGAHGWNGEIHTKFDPALTPRDSITASLARLGRTSVDVVYLHDPSVLTRRDETSIMDAAAGAAQASALLGVSIYDTAEFELAIAHADIAVIQVPISILDRRFIGARLESALDAGKIIHARSVLLQGVLVTESDSLPTSVSHLAPWVAEIRQIARSCRISPYELALGWVAALPGIAGLILGATTPAEVIHFAETLGSEGLDSNIVTALSAMRTPDASDVDPRQWIEPG